MHEVIGRLYALLFARANRPAQWLNHALYHLALRGMGFNNGWQLNRSGELWFIRHMLPRTLTDLLVVDVGANRGEYSRTVLRHAPYAKVVAFEPLVGCMHELAVMQQQYGLHRFVARNVAVGAEAGEALIHFGENDSEWASLATELPAYADAANVNSARVGVTTLDSQFLLDERIHLLKIDVEGLEYEVLQGAERLIKENPPRWVQLEMNTHQLLRGHTLRQLAELLPGYEVFQLLPRGMRRVDLDRPEPNTFCYGNFVFHHGCTP